MEFPMELPIERPLALVEQKNNYDFDVTSGMPRKHFGEPRGALVQPLGRLPCPGRLGIGQCFDFCLLSSPNEGPY